MKIQKELDETKITLHETIESVLHRGEKIDDLVAKSDGLSNQSKMFYRRCSAGGMCSRDGANLSNRTGEETEWLLCSYVDWHTSGVHACFGRLQHSKLGFEMFHNDGGSI